MAEIILSCHDGDTCLCLRQQKKVKIRLKGIDAPEVGQSGALEATHFLESLVKGKAVILNCDGQSWGRENCSIEVGGVDVQKELVRAGWALDYPKYSSGKYRTYESAARAANLGVWNLKGFISPYCFKYPGIKECTKNSLYQP